MKRFLLFFLALLLFSPAVYGKENKVVAYLDGKPITYSELKAYAEMLPGDKYKKMLENREGLKKLLNYYIDRLIILEEAKKEIKTPERVFRAHSSLDKDSAYIIAYLSRKVDGEIEVTEEEVEKYAKERGIEKRLAYAELLSKKRREKFKELLRALRKKHKIKFLVR